MDKKKIDVKAFKISRKVLTHERSQSFFKEMKVTCDEENRKWTYLGTTSYRVIISAALDGIIRKLS
jgi:hypothetical protein